MHPLKIPIGLGCGDHQAAHAHRVHRHGRRGHDEGLLSGHRQGNADGVSAAQHQGHRGLGHTGHHLRNGKARLNVAAHGVQKQQYAVHLFALLQRRQQRQYVLVLRALQIVRQQRVSLHLPHDGQAVHRPPAVFHHSAAHIDDRLYRHRRFFLVLFPVFVVAHIRASFLP